MSKAKELAFEALEIFNWVTASNQDMSAYKKLTKIHDLAHEILDEPEPLRGWIECTSVFFDNDRVVLINTRDISSIYIVNDPKDHVLNAKTGICLRRAEEVYFVKESYDEIKQKIKEAS